MNVVIDTQILLLLCSHLAVTSESMKPYKLKEWNELAHKIVNSPLKRPRAFLETSPDQWKNELGVSNIEVQRIEKLLSRAGQLAIELERLHNMGIWVTSRADSHYPSRFKKVLKHQAPVVLFGAGDPQLIEKEGVSVVGSRDVDEYGIAFTEKLGAHCAREGLTVISGGAKGVDTIAQQSAIRSGGQVVAIPSEGLELAIKKREIRQAILSGQLTLLSANHPKTRFTVASAMGRNKYIYALSQYAVVVSSSYNKGGTWTGAVENLAHRWGPLFVRTDTQVPLGNTRLLEQGGVSLPTEILSNMKFNLRDWLAEASQTFETQRQELNLTKDIEDKRDSAANKEKHAINIDTPKVVDLYDVVWPYIERLVNVERSVDELAHLLSVQRSQMESWLERAESENKIKKSSDSSKYVDITSSPYEQVTLNFLSK